MRRFRTPISLVLGLLLLVQGWAVAATSMMAFGTPDFAISASAQTAEVEMPCHQQKSEAAKSAKTQPESSCPCCDGNCPDMQACAAAHPAMPSSLALSLPRLTALAPSTAESRIAIRNSSSLLKPPISLQA